MASSFETRTAPATLSGAVEVSGLSKAFGKHTVCGSNAAAPPGEGGDDSSVDPLQPWSWAVQ